MEQTGLRPRETCTACGACAASCPVNAITMKEDTLGCKYPAIAEQTCIRCGKCEAACRQMAELPLHIPRKAYAAFGREKELVKNSASGGMFSALALACMEDGGMAAGAVMELEDGALTVHHICSGRREDLLPMQGSKYVQSDAWRCYPAVMAALKEGKTVLFSGTPCQVAAMKALTGDPQQLVTMDLVCHGVPPAQMLEQFLRLLGKRFGTTVQAVNFRDKSCKKSFCAAVRLKTCGRTKTVFLGPNQLSFYRYFLDGATYRENCYGCAYAGPERVADLTVGDYWGIKTVHADEMAAGQMPREADWSCLLVNTEKGEKFLHTYEDRLCLFPSEPALAARHNGQLRQPSQKPPHRQQVLQRYLGGGYAAVEKGFIRDSGGAVRYYCRLIKAAFRNAKAERSAKQKL